MKITTFFRRHISMLIVSVLVLASLACSLTARETPIAESTQTQAPPTTEISAQSEPALSGEGGDLIAFIRLGDICVMELDGSNTRCLTDDGSVYLDSLAWSPDGSQIAFVSDRDGDGCEIYAVGVDGGDVRRLTHENHCNSSPAWSPDGSQIAFASNRDGNDNIYVMAVDGSNVRRLSGESYWNGYPTWSPDSSQIAFVSVRSPNNHEICVMSAVDGPDLYCLTESNTMPKNLTWSPDGSRIAFVSDQNGNDDIYVLEVDGNNIRRLTEDSAVESSPTWSPDSSQISFASQSNDDESIYVMEADGSNVRPLTDSGDWEMSPAWRPDRDRVVVAVANAPVPAPAPIATPTSRSTSQELTLIKQGFSHSNSNKAIVSFAFIVENPDTELAVKSAPYQITVFDETGTVLGTASGKIGIVFPGAQLGVVGDVVVPQNTTVAKLDVQIESGDSAPSEITENPFVTEQVNYFPHQMAPRVTGVVKSSLAQDIGGVNVMAIVFDENDAIIGSGHTLGVSIPAYGQVAVEINVATTGESAKVELYPVFYEYNALKEAPTKEPLVVETTGVIQVPQETYGKFAFVIKNLGQVAVGYVGYNVVAYNEAGQVLTTVSDQIGIIYPGERLGVECSMRLPEKERTNVARLEVQFEQSHEWPDMEAFELKTNPVTAEQATYISDPNFPKVTGIVKSSWRNDIEAVTVTAIAFDESNVIIGSGSGWAGLVPADGQVEVEIPMDMVGEPARIELFAKVGPTDIR